MFFNKKPKQKTDPKVRFQHRQFTKKLDKARQFKRVPRVVPETNIDKFLSKFYLGNRWSQIALGLAACGVVYILLVPNFLSVKTIIVNGVSGSDAVLIENAVRQAIANAPFYNPQHNLLITSRKQVSRAATSVPIVHEVENVSKDYQSKAITVTVKPKYERFVFRDYTRALVAYNDGTLKGEHAVPLDQWETAPAPGMVKLKVEGVIRHGQSQSTLSEQFRSDVETAASELARFSSSPMAYVQIGSPQPASVEGGTEVKPLEYSLPLHSDELYIKLMKNSDPADLFTVIFDARSDIKDAIKRLELLLSQMSAERYIKLYYIDMRLENRGYICLVNTPCQE